MQFMVCNPLPLCLQWSRWLFCNSTPIVKVASLQAHYYVIYFPRNRQGHGKNATVELDDMADSHSNESKEDQDADTFFDHGIYEKIPSKKQNASVELTGLVGRGSAETKEDQDMPISVDNICYDKLTSKLHPKSKVCV